MKSRNVTPTQVSLLARELHAVLEAAEILDNEPQQMPLYWVAERLSAQLEAMTEKLEKRGGES